MRSLFAIILFASSITANGAVINGWGEPLSKACIINVSGTTSVPIFSVSGCATSFRSNCLNTSSSHNYRYMVLGHNESYPLNSDHSITIGGIDIKAELSTPAHHSGFIGFGEGTPRSGSGNWNCIQGQNWESLREFAIKFTIKVNELGIKSATDFHYNSIIGYYIGVYATSALSTNEINSISALHGSPIFLKGSLKALNSCEIVPVSGIVEFNFQSPVGEKINEPQTSRIIFTCPKTTRIKTQFIGFKNQKDSNNNIQFTDGSGRVNFNINIPEYINVESGIKKEEIITATLVSATTPGQYTATGILVTTYE
ncbi:hypothetical protein M8A54_004174 [Salmonella enterica]|nr:hypothetical protein [Salmonella enterica]